VQKGRLAYKYIYKIIPLLFCLIINLTTANSQEVHFSQFYVSPLFMSPSFAGTTKGTRITANYRNQWPQVGHAYVTYAAGIDHSFTDLRNGIGFQAVRDEKGEVGLNNTFLHFQYSYVVVASRKMYLRPGIQFSYVFNGVDYSRLRLREQVLLDMPVPTARPEFTPYNYMDVATSILAYTNIYWIGLKADHLLRPTQIPDGETRLPLNFDVFGGFTFKFYNSINRVVDDNISCAIHLMWTDKFTQMDIGAMGLKNNIQMGLWYRGIPALKKNAGSDALIMSIGYIFYNFSIAYSHDFTISGLNNFSNGSDEVSLVYIFNQNQKSKKKKGAVKCPRFGR
jgi:type IX secretion system PorP/SprF family membrane protein